MEATYKGECYCVVHCKGALRSLNDAMKSVSPTKKHKSMLISLKLQVERLSSGRRTPELSIKQEGLLPSYQGKPPKHFFAIKKIPIRGYFWESDFHDMTYFISHYIYKDFDKLDSNDTAKVCNNWKRIEEGNDEH